MSNKKKLSLSGKKSLDEIVKASRHREKYSRYWCYHATEISNPKEFETLTREQGEDYKNWDNFGSGLSLDTLKRFTNEEFVNSDAFDVFCKVASEEADVNRLNISLNDTEFIIFDPISQFKELREEMICLLHHAHVGLLLQTEDLIEISKLYSNKLNLKNKAYASEDGEVQLIDPEKLFCDAPDFPHEKIFQLKLFTSILPTNNGSPTKLTWGYALVNTETGRSELLLDTRPYVWQGEEVKIGQKKIRRLKLLGENSFTENAIRLMEDAYRRYFEGHRTITNFGGWLKDTNLKKFREEYAILKDQNPSWEDSELIEKAFLKTSFGKARYSLGITIFRFYVLERDQSGIPLMIFVNEARRRE